MLRNEPNGETFSPKFPHTQKAGRLSAADKESMVDHMQDLAAALNREGHDLLPVFECIRDLRREIIKEKMDEQHVSS